MNTCTACLVKQKFYLDSVALMRSSKALTELEGVKEAAMMMGTPANIEIMHNAGLLDSSTITATPSDLIIAVMASNESSAQSAMQAAEQLLNTPRSVQQGTAWNPKSIRGAVKLRPSLNLALISVPGAFAVSEARKAIRRGLHVMIFSDNVSIEQEAQLKREAQQLGKLVMGPDCGTAIINGVPLAFANKVPRGDIALIGASGTGIQEITCLLAQHGQGISQAVGVGGRDLHEQVGGVSTMMAMAAIESDTNTRHVVLVSKPPAQALVDQLLKTIAGSAKSYTLCFLGGKEPELPANCKWAKTLSEAAFIAANLSVPSRTVAIPTTAQRQPNKLICGLFCGGTLCTESLLLFKEAGLAVSSNVKIPDMVYQDHSHQLLDLGADEFTQGKPHPMIEPGIRDAAVVAALEDQQIGVLLVDVVIGFGSHSDPAAQLLSAISSCKINDNGVQIVASVTGTDDDPQVRSHQVKKLEASGVLVASSNEAATRLALALITPEQ